MAFPTTSVLDDFNRANENPLSSAGSWGTSIFDNFGGAGDSFKLVSNAIQDDSAADGAGSGQAFWDGATYGPAVEVYVTFTTIWGNASSDFWFWLQGSGEDNASNANLDGYIAYAAYSAGSWVYTLSRVDNGVSTEIRAAQTGPTLANGDKLGMECSASGVFTWYHKPAAGSWGAASGLSTTTDTTYTSGHIGLSKGYADTTSVLDDFGGGNVVGGGGSTAVPVFAHHLRQQGIA